MFTIRFKTTAYRPDMEVTLRNSVDGWNNDIPGLYKDDEWQFNFPLQPYIDGFHFKFILERRYWMNGNNLYLKPHDGKDYPYTSEEVKIPPITEAIVENSYFQQMFFQPNLDETHMFDVIVIGSGIGGGTVGEQLSDLGVDVLIIEAGSLLFQTHVANLPRQHQIGKFDKHLWGLFDEYKVVNYINSVGSNYFGGQAFNLGGRSVFWGGLIPRMTAWELEDWPLSVAQYLQNSGYQRAEDMMYWPSPPAQFQQEIKLHLTNNWPTFDHFDAPMAVRHLNPSFGTISTGLFSTADLLTEARLTVDPGGTKAPSINLNQAVIKLETNGSRVSSVVAIDLLAEKQRTYKARYIILAAGTIESAKIIKLSGLADPNNLVGRGITDHPIFFTHFSIPQTKKWHRMGTSCKVLSRHKWANKVEHPYNMLIELGADLNQGRYLDNDTLLRHRAHAGNAALCEIVFLFNSPLFDLNNLHHAGSSAAKPSIYMKDSPSADPWIAEVSQLKDDIIRELEGEALPGENLLLNRAPLGGVAHEVGTLRMGQIGSGVVNENLMYHEYENLFVCDLSVFPTCPAANPTLTLAALALRLSDHIKALL